MKKLLTLITALLLTVSCVVFATGCGKDPEYTIQDCFTLEKTSYLATNECTIDDLLGNEPTEFDSDIFAIKTKKPLKITKISYDNDRINRVIINNDSIILKEYKAGEKIDFSHLSPQNLPLNMHNLVIEFKVL